MTDNEKIENKSYLGYFGEGTARMGASLEIETVLGHYKCPNCQRETVVELGTYAERHNAALKAAWEMWVDMKTVATERDEIAKSLRDALRLIARKDKEIKGLQSRLRSTEIALDRSTKRANLSAAQHLPQFDYFALPIESLDMSIRTFNLLKRDGITHVGDLLHLWADGPDALLAIKNFGAASLKEVEQALHQKGYLAHGRIVGVEVGAEVLYDPLS